MNLDQQIAATGQQLQDMQDALLPKQGELPIDPPYMPYEVEALAAKQVMLQREKELLGGDGTAVPVPNPAYGATPLERDIDRTGDKLERLEDRLLPPQGALPLDPQDMPYKVEATAAKEQALENLEGKREREEAAVAASRPGAGW